MQTPQVGSATPAPDAATIEQIVRNAAETYGLRAVIYRVDRAGQLLATGATGDSITGVPATTAMHFRNGSVAIGYLGMLLLILSEEGVVALDDTIDAWLPDLPDADQVTLRMLLDMTAGYPDYVPAQAFEEQFNVNPFRSWTPDELIEWGLTSLPRSFAPGTNWDYSHTNIVIFGRAIEAATGRDLAGLLREKVLDPLGLSNTVSEGTAAMPEPVLHAFSSERREPLKIPADTPFLEETTYWSPSWTLAPGAVQTTNIDDLAITATAWGTGALLSPAAHAHLIEPFPQGFGSVIDGCRTCHPLDDQFNYGLGLVISYGWILQNPLLGGYSAIAAYLPAEQLSIAVAVTFTPEAFDESGAYRRESRATTVAQDIARLFTDIVPLSAK